MWAVGVRQRATQSGVAIGIEGIVVTKGEGEFAERLIELHAVRDGVLLVPQQATLDVHVLEAESGLGSHQRGQDTEDDVRVFRKRNPPKRRRNGTPEVAVGCRVRDEW